MFFKKKCISSKILTKKIIINILGFIIIADEED